ncbi:hypothetical protein LCGC14_2154730 [marine sediment metagenome]|uniref:Alcohol dehydrogenase-like N-terminal domain-containing protein n=1 Tax=marine sediment metagenome TaxID=412755 RepID=A0A0F9G7J6_9ZZZZ
MKALVLEQYNKLVYKDWPDPVMADDEVMIEVKAVGICGSDVHGMDGSTGRRIPPIIMGHEAAGVIVSTGKDVEGWNPGDRVTFDSTIYRLDDWYTKKGLYNLSDNRMVLGVSPWGWCENRPLRTHVCTRSGGVPVGQSLFAHHDSIGLDYIQCSPSGGLCT